ncbi:hypothetical protein B0H16DRAFT_1482196 [Mycena metata]|uniref:Uncharacterized protein n=1 Tax=Mycena metata TaxID=1033252 RepID=A0AAD7GUY2_9AGAR|nr:hypothetical protein B0H16DRAFT_1487415 [Mycena metata]KAJ7705723.1 hypothetical protein B0H16DRAFT_1482196 [Mycena metata]
MTVREVIARTSVVISVGHRAAIFYADSGRLVLSFWFVSTQLPWDPAAPGRDVRNQLGTKANDDLNNPRQKHCLRKAKAMLRDFFHWRFARLCSFHPNYCTLYGPYETFPVNPQKSLPYHWFHFEMANSPAAVTSVHTDLHPTPPVYAGWYTDSSIPSPWSTDWPNWRGLTLFHESVDGTLKVDKLFKEVYDVPGTIEPVAMTKVRRVVGPVILSDKYSSVIAAKTNQVLTRSESIYRGVTP